MNQPTHKLITSAAKKQLLAQGYKEVSERGDGPASGKSFRLRQRFPNHDIIIAEENEYVEVALVRPRAG